MRHEAHWFDARRLFAGGRYPEAVSSALKVLPELLDEIRRVIGKLAPRRALEVGPGDRPAMPASRTAVYLDLVPEFLAGRRGVQGDLRRAPFRSDAFDLVVANDVFTHIVPAERPAALAELARLGRRVLIFNPEPGTPGIEGSSVPTDDLVSVLTAAGMVVETRSFVAHAASGPYTMAILTARRGSSSPAPPVTSAKTRPRASG